MMRCFSGKELISSQCCGAPRGVKEASPLLVVRVCKGVCLKESSWVLVASAFGVLTGSPGIFARFHLCSGILLIK